VEEVEVLCVRVLVFLKYGVESVEKTLEWKVAKEFVRLGRL
jgi:hypothetical protein